MSTGRTRTVAETERVTELETARETNGLAPAGAAAL